MQKSDEKLNRLEEILRALGASAMSTSDIMITFGMSRSTAQRAIASLRDDIYISRWNAGRQGIAALYRAGNEPDAPHPTGRMKGGDMRKRKDDLKKESGKIKRDPLIEAFYGQHRTNNQGSKQK